LPSLLQPEELGPIYCAPVTELQEFDDEAVVEEDGEYGSPECV